MPHGRRISPLAPRPRICSTADGKAMVAAIVRLPIIGAKLFGNRPMIARLSGRKYSAAHPIGRARGNALVGQNGSRTGCDTTRQCPTAGASGVRGVGREIAPRKNQFPNSRDNRLVCLPCQPKPAACARGFFHHGCGIYEHLDLAAGAVDQPAAQPFQPFLDHIMVIAALRIGGNHGAFPQV